MEKLSRSSEWVLVLITVLPLMYLASIWSVLPAEVPTHFSAEGQPNAYNSKESLAIGLVVLSAFIYGLLRVLPAIDPRKHLNSASYARIRFTMTLFVAGLSCVILYIIHAGKTGEIVSDLILSAVFLLLAAMGNVMLTVPQNYFVGIRTPWALASQENWRKTHRMAGKLWVSVGLAAFVVSLFLPAVAKTGLTVVVVFVLAVVPYVYSYRLFKQGLVVALFLLAATSAVQAQTEETIQYAITQPAGASLTLEGTLTLPANVKKRVPVVLLIAGSGPTDRNGNSSAPGYQQMNMFRQLADSLTKRGVAVLRYDKRGSGTNSVLYAVRLNKSEANFDYGVDDAVGFIRQLQADKRFSSVTVAGHSEGSLVGMLAAAQTKVTRFISIAGAGQNIADIIKVQFANGGVQGDALITATRDLDSLKAGQAVKQPPMMLASFFAPKAQPYLISWMKYDPADVIKAFKGPVLILQGKRDIQVAVTEAERLKAARPDAKLVFFDTMNHILKEAPAERMANMATYSNPNLSIVPALADTIADFVGKR
ncbi:alpha/beta fold hydrolase [Fibrella forsythiae]|uniref:Alpha/beta fold hydrolase n=1 Tax=Fibrella forsythiae TaxID=2817061 RepID=A0ABS3JCW1_9BACT|nr:alpha/beta fold hydrolase [Fibrella forsythiae]MBO0947841.1 alpha/beta fold hydrolase [Fibrella forsythiae]